VHRFDERTIGYELFWMHPMELQDDEAQVEAHFGPFRDSANLVARYVHSLAPKYHMLRNCFGCNRWYS
jgi:hypothetical protein